ncbi:class I SAM-dependent methyltransferase [Pollutibacter soli]|uniref:class I SAM-dependent methyltransferase n=1 Tax=Pollutibacter soli TaxID=3034157 RepID=UPI0030140E22
MESKQAHWEEVYRTKTSDQVSWTQEKPLISLELIHSFELPLSAKIIDIGGGDSKLVDHLLEEGFSNITVLDISSKALEKAKQRLGRKADMVNWIVNDINNFDTNEKFDLWHDRAAFHFLTESDQIKRYTSLAAKSVSGFMIIGTFAIDGPENCSGLPVTRYSINSLVSNFNSSFNNTECKSEEHRTPAGKIQHFIFCGFKRK